MSQLPQSFFPFIWHFAKKQGKSFAASQLFSLGWALDNTLWPILLMVIVDTISQHSEDRSAMWQFLAFPIIMGLTLWISIDLCYRFSGIILAKALPKFEADIRSSMFNYVQRHSYSYFSNHFAGTIANKISDMPQSCTRILQSVIQLFNPVIFALIISIFLFSRINLYFACILIVWIILHIGVSLFFARKCSNLSNVHAEARSELSGKNVDSLSNNNNVRLFARFNYETKYFQKYQDEEQAKHHDSLWYIEKMKIGMSIFSFLGTGIAMNGYMLYSWQQGYLTTGEVVYIFNTTWNVVMMAWFASLELPGLYREIGICTQALSIIQDPHDVVDAPDAKPLKITKGVIKFENVTFHYRPNQNIFENKNIIINAGEKVGLVGFSGSGKTTFAHLILRYFDVEKGRILIDDQDISLVTQDSLRSQIAFIPQDASLFHRTLIENIRYGCLEATDDDVVEAARQAHCDEFIERLSDGFHTMVGERGLKLSGGQRQRIAIARAMLKNSPILILDEATSALDSITERLIQDSLQHLMQGRTTIVIAHRLSTLSGMDRILVFEEGRIIEEGSHDELLADQGHYAAMWGMQAGGFLPENGVVA